MISENIAALRRSRGLSQEALADKVGVSRQTIAKWESGESAPDILHCDALAETLNVTLDDLLHSDLTSGSPAPRGKHVFGMVTVNEKGQIIIPVKARKIFHIQPGDSLMLLGDEQQGLALIKADLFIDAAKKLKGGDFF